MPIRSVTDPLTGPRIALTGRVVTMDAASTVVDRGVVYIEKGGVVAVQPENVSPPPGFEKVKPVGSGGTIYPGLIELHNHLAYDALRLWQVPKKYVNRSQWGGTPEYRRLISGPMTVLGKTPDLLPAVIRYVECKCLVAGVTTSQGIELFSNHGARRFYRGIVRNVEQTEDPDLPDATAKISDVEATQAARFLARLQKASCFLLHLSEGTDMAARRHFEALRIAPETWAVTPALAGIHCAALTRDDFATLGQLGGAMVWSPMSNLLLYGGTARVRDAKRCGVRIGIGSDWSPTGSKNLLGELKVARLVSRALSGLFSDAEIVGMATRTAAAILQWDRALGSLERGKRADLLVVDGAGGDPYSALIDTRETGIRLVMIAGVARFGRQALMRQLGAEGETVRVGGRLRTLHLTQEFGDPVVGKVTLAQARRTLSDALGRLPSLAKAIETAPRRATAVEAFGLEPLSWALALDELQDTGSELRPRLGVRRGPAVTGPVLGSVVAAGVPLSSVLTPLDLDPLTVADDPDYLEAMGKQKNLPPGVRDGLPDLYD